ncbi:uncharacterized protein LOC143820064 isoform X6 [Paroedura picta]|uniref:uncharacterized protein LOC143820064 isoform X6 n=1 Tax=Paroedura picta TaxID=143630 RepID=UPI004057C521
MQVFNNTWLSFGVHTFPTSNRFLFASAGPVSGSWIARKECDEWLSGERSEQGGRARPGTRISWLRTRILLRSRCTEMPQRPPDQSSSIGNLSTQAATLDALKV